MLSELAELSFCSFESKASDEQVLRRGGGDCYEDRMKLWTELYV